MGKVTKRLRYEILRRDGFRCRYCGATPAETELRVDHVVPEALGGASAPSNLATACDPCNTGKSSVPPEAPVVEQVAADALRWSAAMQRPAADMEAKLQERDDRNAGFLNQWREYAFPLDSSWSQTLTRLRTAGLTDTLITEAVNATMGASKVLPENRFRYFCGVAWNMIAQLQESADKMASGDAGDDELFPELTRSEIASVLDLFRAVTEKFVGLLPTSIRESAETSTEHEFVFSKRLDASYIERLPFTLLFAALDLRDCNFRAPEEGEAQ